MVKDVLPCGWLWVPVGWVWVDCLGLNCWVCWFGGLGGFGGFLVFDAGLVVSCGCLVMVFVCVRGIVVDFPWFSVLWCWYNIDFCRLGFCAVGFGFGCELSLMVKLAMLCGGCLCVFSLSTF